MTLQNQMAKILWGAQSSALGYQSLLEGMTWLLQKRLSLSNVGSAPRGFLYMEVDGGGVMGKQYVLKMKLNRKVSLYVFFSPFFLQFSHFLLTLLSPSCFSCPQPFQNTCHFFPLCMTCLTHPIFFTAKKCSWGL